MGSSVKIRSLASMEDYYATVKLQQDIWGPGIDDIVSPLLMMVMHKVGAVAAGAFVDEQLVGLVYGFPGYYDGRLIHWSHILAISKTWRDQGIGLRLKEFQRAQVLESGIGHMLWTFDPLESRNAYFNLEHIGAEVLSYHRDMYGPGDSNKHFSGLGPDRFIVDWDLASYQKNGGYPLASNLAAAGVKILDDVPDLTTEESDDPQLDPILRISVPGNIQALKRKNPSLASTIRNQTRAAFEFGFAHQYKVSGYFYDRASDTGNYLLIHF